MARKNVTLDEDAYRRLSRIKMKHETFSDVIKRVVPTSPSLVSQKQFDFDGWLKAIEANPASDEFIAAVEEQVRNRRRGLD